MTEQEDLKTIIILANELGDARAFLCEIKHKLDKSGLDLDDILGAGICMRLEDIVDKCEGN